MSTTSDAAVVLGGIRARGSRLDPGEVEEIELLVQRGEVPELDQVLGLIETTRALARRCAVRFAEKLELRDQVTDLQVQLEQLSVTDRTAEVLELRAQLDLARDLLADVRQQTLDQAMTDVLDGIRDGISPEANSHFMAGRLMELRRVLAASEG